MRRRRWPARQQRRQFAPISPAMWRPKTVLATDDDVAAQVAAGLPPCYTPDGVPYYTPAGNPATDARGRLNRSAPRTVIPYITRHGRGRPMQRSISLRTDFAAAGMAAVTAARWWPHRSPRSRWRAPPPPTVVREIRPGRRHYCASGLITNCTTKRSTARSSVP